MADKPQHGCENYDWQFLREWCLWYVGVFLQFADMEGRPAYDWFHATAKDRPINWTGVKKAKNLAARYVVETITAQVSEAAATREALPGDFLESVASLKRREWLLRRGLTAEETWGEMQAVDTGRGQS